MRFSPDDVHTTLIIGLGNPLLGDDGVGWRIAEEVQREVKRVNCMIEVDCLAVGGLRLMESMAGYDHVILVDAMTTGEQPPGSLHCLSLDDLPEFTAGHLNCSHDMSLQTAFRVGKALGIPLPDKVIIVGVEAERTYDFTEKLSAPVAESVLVATQLILEMLRQPLQKDERQ